MASQHGAKQQKRIAKQKAKRQAKQKMLSQRTSTDPTIRLQSAAKWPIVHSLVDAGLWDQGIGHLLIARKEPDGGVVFAVYLVDVLCLGVKNAFWRAGTQREFDDIVKKLENNTGSLRAITPECLAKIVHGGVAFAQSFGFPPHPDYRHAARLLDGIDPASCRHEFSFGRDGKPFYISGPNESAAEAQAIAARAHQVGGHYISMVPPTDMMGFPSLDDDDIPLRSLEVDDDDDDE